MSDETKAEIEQHPRRLSAESRERIERAQKTIFEIFAGRPKEELCAALCAIAVSDGFYDEAIRFAQMAIVHRDSVVHAGGSR